MRLTLIIANLTAGGAERQLSLMANHWAAAGWEITLLTFYGREAATFYPLDSRVKRRVLDIGRASGDPFTALFNNARRIAVLREAIRASRPEAIISFIDQINILTLFAKLGLGVPILISERIHPAFANSGRVWKWLRPLVYPLADAVVVQTEAAQRHLSSYPCCKLEVIPNAIIAPPAVADTATVRLNKPAVVAVGRLVPQKGFDLLIEAFARTRQAHPEWHLHIFGEGAQRNQLQRQQAASGLNGFVHLPGTTDNIHKIYRNADLFVLSSRFEGFPNALCEAMAASVPVIAFDCPAGPREILRDGLDGVLVPDGNVEELANAMIRLMSNETERARLGARGAEILERFCPEKVMAMWEKLLTRICGIEQVASAG